MDQQGLLLIALYRIEAEWLFNCSYRGRIYAHDKTRM